MCTRLLFQKSSDLQHEASWKMACLNFQARLSTVPLNNCQSIPELMKYLGLQGPPRRKMSYYADGHEREDVIADRKFFCELLESARDSNV
jgi:hypothetical protein